MKRFSGLLLVMVMMAATVGAAQQAGNNHTEKVAVAFDAWAKGTGSPFDLLADNAEWTITGYSAAAGTYSRQDFISEVIQPFNARMDGGLKPSVRKLYTDGNTVIVFFDAEGTAIDGVPYKNTYTWYLEFEQEQIVRVFAFFDSIAFNELWQRVTP
ncbi:hypothetical protein QE250_06180 [Chromatiaceae bacterium AAb-1]|nr:hypothetical protein [Chromatiaceae bacterium AAb-1]